MEKIAADAQNKIDETYRIAIVIVSAQILVVVALTAATFFVSPAAIGPRIPVDTTALMVLIVFIAAASFVIRRLLSRRDRFRDAKLLGGNEGLLSTLKNNAVIVAVFAELMGLIGFATYVFGGDQVDMFRAFAASVMVFAINFPRKSVWEKIVWNLEKI